MSKDNMLVWVLDSIDDNPDFPNYNLLGLFRDKPSVRTLVSFFKEEGLSMGRDNSDVLYILEVFTTLSEKHKVKCDGVTYNLSQMRVHP